MEAWLLLTAYRKSPAPYPPTTYRLATIHPWQTGRRTTTMAIAQPLLKYGRRKTRITSPGAVCLQATPQTRLRSCFRSAFRSVRQNWLISASKNCQLGQIIKSLVLSSLIKWFAYFGLTVIKVLTLSQIFAYLTVTARETIVVQMHPCECSNLVHLWCIVYGLWRKLDIYICDTLFDGAATSGIGWQRPLIALRNYGYYQSIDWHVIFWSSWKHQCKRSRGKWESWDHDPQFPKAFILVPLIFLSVSLL